MLCIYTIIKFVLYTNLDKFDDILHNMSALWGMVVGLPCEEPNYTKHATLLLLTLMVD